MTTNQPRERRKRRTPRGESPGGRLLGREREYRIFKKVHVTSLHLIPPFTPPSPLFPRHRAVSCAGRYALWDYFSAAADQSSGGAKLFAHPRRRLPILPEDRGAARVINFFHALRPRGGVISLRRPAIKANSAAARRRLVCLVHHSVIEAAGSDVYVAAMNGAVGRCDLSHLA